MGELCGIISVRTKEQQQQREWKSRKAHRMCTRRYGYCWFSVVCDGFIRFSLSLSSSHLSGIFCSLLTADCCCISHYVVARAYEQLQYNAQNGKENRWKRFVSVADLLMPPLSTATPFGPSQTDFLVWWCNVLISSVVVDFGIHFVFTKKKIKISRLSAHIAWAFSPFHIGVDSFEMVQQCSCSETRIGSHARSRSISELIVGNTRSHHLSIPTSALMATYRSMTLLIYRQR